MHQSIKERTMQSVEQRLAGLTLQDALHMSQSRFEEMAEQGMYEKQRGREAGSSLNVE